ncbi:unnamed protein product [Porites evermanni]|uniref:Uncharacterized protein n=1 Tax=Porites evermanni TaxID=104178 RepID=A0ABN8SYV3_9CNID|nr:unnamed protein product [Porites evermanni]
MLLEMYEPVLAVKFIISLLCVITDLKAGLSIPLSSKSGNNVQIPPIIVNHNESRLLNVTSNNLNSSRTNLTSIITAVPTVLTTKPSRTHIVDVMFGENNNHDVTSSNNVSNSSVSDITSTAPSLLTLSTHVQNHTTVSPSQNAVKHHFNTKIVEYVIIPIGCLLVVLISYCLIRQVQKVRRKRRLERELFHQYSYPNSEADDLEERNIGDVESVINAQFVCINSDRSDKNLYEDSHEVNLAFDETSKLVVQEPVSPELEASTSFQS